MVRGGGGGGGKKNDMAGYEDFVYILGRGENKIGLVFWGVISMQFWVLSLVQCTKYRMRIVWGLLKFHFYLSIFKLKMRQVRYVNS